MWEYMNTNELVHHGIKGQKWGVRRYQNSDGSYTNAGKKRYAKSNPETIPEDAKQYIVKGETLERTNFGSPHDEGYIIKTVNGKNPYDATTVDQRDIDMSIKSTKTAYHFPIDEPVLLEFAKQKAAVINWDYNHEDLEYSHSYFSPQGKRYECYMPDDASKRFYVESRPTVDIYEHYYESEQNKVKHSAIQPWSYTNTNELCHYGRKGMKWGVRLYQNPDGSLTALGRQRYGTKENFGRVVAAKQKAAAFKKNKKAYEKQAAKNAKADEEIREIKRKAGMKTDNSQNGLPKGKKISEMSNKEIQERINRIQLEKTLRREMASVQVERISRGKKAVDTLLKVYNNQAVQTAIINPVAKQVGKKLTDAMSGGEISKSERLKKQKDDYMNEWQINKYKKETAEFKKAYEDMRRDPAYRTVFDKADRQQVKKDDARINKEMQREQQRAQDKADLKANREAAKERKRQQQEARMEEYRRQQEAQVAERERKQREQTQARLVDDTVYNQYLLNKNAEALRREEERRRRGGR